MSEAKRETTDAPNMSNESKANSGERQGAWFRNWLREGAERANAALRPPEGAAKHFDQAQLEVLRGVRELIDYRIERLSRDRGNKGNRIVVE